VHKDKGKLVSIGKKERWFGKVWCSRGLAERGVYSTGVNLCKESLWRTREKNTGKEKENMKDGGGL